jgi:hypothetical protein
LFPSPPWRHAWKLDGNGVAGVDPRSHRGSAPGQLVKREGPHLFDIEDRGQAVYLDLDLLEAYSGLVGFPD